MVIGWRVYTQALVYATYSTVFPPPKKTQQVVRLRNPRENVVTSSAGGRGLSITETHNAVN